MFKALRRLAATARARLSMPLLRKELVETAARRRTFILRVAYAVLLYVIFAATLPRRLFVANAANEPYGMLGIGRELFEQLALMQAFGVLLFQPAFMCGRITQEKERDSLVLLFLTELRPWEIVLQKYLGGLVPMFSFLLLGLPLAGVAYAFGGLESRYIVENVLGVLLSSFQVGALALMCSAWCRTTVSALISSYLLTVALYCGPPLLLSLIWSVFHISGGYEFRESWILLVPEGAVEMAGRKSAHALACLAPSILSILLFILLARLFLVRRAFTPPSNFIARVFARIDRLMKSANRFVGGVVLYRDSASLPGDDPVFWRETQRRVLGKPHYLVRLLCVIEIPTVLLCMAVAMSEAGSWDPVSLSITALILGGLAIFSLAAISANSIVSERVGQTLEVLLTTPLSAGEIIRQKERALRRLEWVLAAPLLTVFATKVLLLRDENVHWVAYAVCSVLVVAIYLPMTTWLSLWIGLRVRTRFQAILTALGSLTFWMALAPILFIVFPGDPRRETGMLLLFLVSPLTVPVLNEAGELFPSFGDNGGWIIILVNAALFATIAIVIRRSIFRNADRCLRR